MWTRRQRQMCIRDRYEGFDERIRCLADEEISIGDYVLSGGEIPALSIISGLTRLLPGTLGDPDSLTNESHNSPLLEHPQYTRPQIFRNMKVPDVLTNGNHKDIKLWRKEQQLDRTTQRRKDLFKSELSDQNVLHYDDDWFWNL